MARPANARTTGTRLLAPVAALGNLVGLGVPQWYVTNISAIPLNDC